MTFWLSRIALYTGWFAVAWNMTLAIQLGGLTMIFGAFLALRSSAEEFRA